MYFSIVTQSMYPRAVVLAISSNMAFGVKNNRYNMCDTAKRA